LRTGRAGSLPYLLLVAATLLWSGNFVLGRAVHGRIPPVALAFWRWAVALAVLLAISAPRVRAQWPALRRHWRVLVPLGILGVGNFNTMVYLGLQETTATNAVLLNSACPAFILAIAFASGGGRPAARQVLGIATSLAGVAVIVSRGDPGALLALSFNRGDAWVLGAVLSWAFYTVLLARRPAGVDPAVLLTALVAVGLAWIAPFYAWEAAQGARMTWDAVAVGSVLYVAVFASLVAYAAWNRAVAEVGASRAGVFLHLMPAFGTVLAVAFLGESFRGFQAAGIALVLLGVTLAGTPRPRLPPAPGDA
jgi:drug/metabolite transporter (DMT)-like permease